MPVMIRRGLPSVAAAVLKWGLPAYANDAESEIRLTARTIEKSGRRWRMAISPLRNESTEHSPGRRLQLIPGRPRVCQSSIPGLPSTLGAAKDCDRVVQRHGWIDGTRRGA